MRTSRTAGVSAGFLVLLLGVWAGIIPFVGPYFHYGFAPDETWHFTLDRLWLDILPAAAAVLGGLMMMSARRRGGGLLGAWLSLAGGVWLVLGPSVSLFWGHAAPGTLQSGIGAPLGGHNRAAVEMIGFFYGAGALITMLSMFTLSAFALLVPAAATTGSAVAAEAPGPQRREEARAGEGVPAGERAQAREGAQAGEEAPRRGLIRRRRRGGAVPGERVEGNPRL